MDKINLSDEALKLVSGGVLFEGWEDICLDIIKLYKQRLGDDAETKQKVKDLFLVSVNDPNSPLEPQDLDEIYGFIENEWDNI